MRRRPSPWRDLQVALVTGASSGIGAATARRLAARGLQVALVARRRDRLETLARELRAAGGVAVTIVADLAKADAPARVHDEATRALGSIDVLISNAGFGYFGLFEAMSEEDARGMIALHSLAASALTRLVLPGMIERGRGSVILVGSVVSHIGAAGTSVYAATKAYLDTFAAGVHREVRGAGVHVGIVKPGPVRTEFYGTPRRGGGIPGQDLGIEPSAVARAIEVAISRRRREVFVPGVFRVVKHTELLSGVLDRVAPHVLARVLPRANAVDDARPRPARPPLVRAPPGLGSVAPMIRDPTGFLLRSFREYGPIFRVRLLSQERVVIAGPEANAFMARQADDALGNAVTWGPFGRELETTTNLTSLDGAHHRALRSALRRGYSRSVLNERVPEVIAMTRAELGSWPAGADVPIVAAMRRLVSLQLGQLLCSASPGEGLADITEVITTALNVLVVQRWPRIMLRRAAYRRAKQRMFHHAERVLRDHEQPGRAPRPRDLVDDLFEAIARDPMLLPTRQDLRVQALGPFIAGLDTVANLAVFFLYELVRDAALLERVRAEIDALFVGPLPPLQALIEALPTTHATLRETLRVYPIAPALARTALSSFEFAGYTIAPETPVLVATSVTHRMPELFAAPERFDPDRFLPPREEHKQAFALTGFGLGAHRCLGASLAEAQLLVIAATLLHSGDLTLAAGHERVRPKIAPTLTAGPRFRLRYRGPRRHPRRDAERARP